MGPGLAKRWACKSRQKKRGKAMMQRSLVLLKPDAVERALVGRIIQRFEEAGLKIAGLKLVWVDKEFAQTHYTEDISRRRGEQVRKALISYVTTGPVIAI